MYRRTPARFFIGNIFGGGGGNQNQNQQTGSGGGAWYERPDPMQNSPGTWWENQRANLRGGRNPTPEDVGTRNPSHPSEWASPFINNQQARTFESNRKMKEEYDRKQQQQPNSNNEGWSPWDNEHYAQQMRKQQMNDDQYFYNQQKYNDKNKKWGYDPQGSSNQPPDMQTYNHHQHMHGQPHSPNQGGGIPFMNSGGGATESGSSTHSGGTTKWTIHNPNQAGAGSGNPAEHMMNSLARFGQMVRSSNQQQQQQGGGGGGGGGGFNNPFGGGGGGGGGGGPFGGGGGGPGGGMFDKMLEWCSQSHAQDIARRMGINLQNSS